MFKQVCNKPHLNIIEADHQRSRVCPFFQNLKCKQLNSSSAEQEVSICLNLPNERKTEPGDILPEEGTGCCRPEPFQLFTLHFAQISGSSYLFLHLRFVCFSPSGFFCADSEDSFGELG